MSVYTTKNSYANFTKLYTSIIEIQLADTGDGQSFDVALSSPGLRPLAVYINLDNNNEMFNTFTFSTAATLNGDTPIYENITPCGVSVQFVSKGYDDNTDSLLELDTLRIFAGKYPTSTNPTPTIKITCFLYGDSIQ